MRRLALAALLPLAAAPAGRTEETAPAPVRRILVELFTSQG